VIKPPFKDVNLLKSAPFHLLLKTHSYIYLIAVSNSLQSHQVFFEDEHCKELEHIHNCPRFFNPVLTAIPLNFGKIPIDLMTLNFLLGWEKITFDL
jgi:hypothetical protein